ncbi:MAG: hypothetical protein FJ225_06065 [Lentisphaerae bacterium]|nr:hypothetical protein [Lentisphaerota bacterium]
MRHRTVVAVLALNLFSAASSRLFAQEAHPVPPSYGEASKVDTPVLRVPFLTKPPTVDGIMAPGEWDDASALSAFRYDIHYGMFMFLAPHQTQVKLYAGYDRENLYFCQVSPIYPEDSWLKARGRFPDTLMHPLYGMLEDDHTELELRPVEDLVLGEKLGLLRWDVNPIGTVCDWHYSTAGGSDFKYTSGAEIRSVADGKTWVIEYRIPLKSLRYGPYDGKDENGRPLVAIPPADGTAYRLYFARGISGNGAFFNNFDDCDWLTGKTKLIFDSKSPVFQLNELGRIMDNQINLQMTLKNHNTRSETVRLGFHVESAEGSVYSSYTSPEIPNGLVELRPGEVKKLHLRSAAPKMTLDGNVLWFDVRSAGVPAKILFQTRLTKFHLMDGGWAGTPAQSFRERRLEVIKTLRPERIPYFDFRVDVSPYTRRLSAVLDRGVVGVKDEVKTAVEAQLIVKNIFEGEEEDVHEFRAPVIGDFAAFDVIATNLRPGEMYSVTALMFDENMKIVGEQTEKEPFLKLNAGVNPHTTATRNDTFNVFPWAHTTVASEDRAREDFTALSRASAYTRFDSFQVSPWMNNKVGLMDEVWEPFIPVRPTDNGFETLKHRFTIDGSGLPAQIEILPDPRELPLELRGGGKAPADVLQAIGRGAQFRAPMRIEAVVDGKRVPAKVVTPAKAIRTGKSEIEYVSALQIGQVPAELKVRYDCDGSMNVSLRYGGDTPVKIDRLELVTDVAGTVDLAFSDTGSSMNDTDADRGECGLPNKPGVLWDSTLTKMELFYTRFVPSFWFGSADRGWSYYCNSDRGWILDRDGSTMQLERDKAGDVTWRVAFVNHPAEVRGRRAIDFAVLTHPAKSKPENFRQHAWHYTVGKMWAQMEIRATANWNASADLLSYLVDDARLRDWWHTAAGASQQAPDDQRPVWRNDSPPYWRYGFAGGAAALNLPDMDRLFEDKAAFYLERMISFGRRVGWWMNDYSPISASQNAATQNAYLRPLKEIGKDELPWHRGFLAFYMRDLYKRLARVHAANNVPPRQQVKSNNAGRLLESYLWNTVMMRTVGAEVGTYEVDLVSRYPNSLYRAMAMNYAGVITTMLPDKCPVGPGDDRRFDRQKLGLALLHDFGVSRDGGDVSFRGGPQGRFQNAEEAVRLINGLEKFGFFRDDDVEKLPFWRNDAQVRMGDRPGDESKVRVTVYRRPLDGGKGYQAIFVILNESEGDIELPLDIRDAKRILGGANTLRAGDVAALKKVPDVLKAAWTADANAAALPALRDFETDAWIPRAGDKGERYGPVYVPYHDYRVLYAECRQ